VWEKYSKILLYFSAGKVFQLGLSTYSTEYILCNCKHKVITPTATPEIKYISVVFCLNNSLAK